MSAWSNRPRQQAGVEDDVPGHRHVGPGLRPRRDRRPGDVRLRRAGVDYGGLVFEDDKPDTLAEAMAALEKGLTEYFEREGIEIE